MEFKLPDVGEGTTEGEIVRWLVNLGDTVILDQPLVEVETDKAVVELPSPMAGVIRARYGEEGEVMAVGATLVVIDPASGSAPSENSARPPKVERPDEETVAVKPVAPSASVQAAPFTRKMARDGGVNLAEVVGSGPHGRIVPDDVRRVLDRQPQLARVETEPSEELEEIIIQGVRRRVADHLSQAWREVPQVTVVEKYDFSELVSVRQQLKAEAAADGGSLTYIAFLAKALALVLREYPELNARWQGQRLFKHPKVHIGFAVNTADGLSVPVIHDVDQMSVREISERIKVLAEGARERKLKPAQLNGSTITVTAGGSLGGLFATPIINPPEVAIVGMYRIQPEAVVRNGAVVSAEIGHLSLTFDHRVVDGMRASAFLNGLGATLSHPTRWLLNLR